jgi:hypothetical protein
MSAAAAWAAALVVSFVLAAGGALMDGPTDVEAAQDTADAVLALGGEP